MKCLVCGHEQEFYFEKQYSDYWGKYIPYVQYFKCPNCGFVLSKTHKELSKDAWENLNLEFHTYIEKDINRPTNQPPYIQQAVMLDVLAKNKIINPKKILDYAGGYGTLAKILSKYFNIKTTVYEKYMSKEYKIKNISFINKLSNKKYETVLCSAYFEHILCREDIDNVVNCVSKNGVLILHTVISDSVPQDINWFYLIPVHCAFFTNKSMEILMQDWGFVYSIYFPISKCWVLFKEKPKFDIEKINEEFQTRYLFSKDGFMDYWKSDSSSLAGKVGTIVKMD